jgi:hypothetical protein
VPFSVSWPGGRTLIVLTVVVAVLVCVPVLTFVVSTAVSAGSSDDSAPSSQDYVAITAVPVAPPAPASTADASTGSYAEHCGGPGAIHRNADNVIFDPRLSGGAMHVHDYVGNLSTNAFSTDESLAAAGTTCANGDRSTFYWPVLRILGEQGQDMAFGNMGRILEPATVDVRFVGSPVSQVVSAPEFLQATVGDAKELTDPRAPTLPRWTCTGYQDRITDRYPMCPNGSRIMRVFDFPNCWNGTSPASPDHYTHVVPAQANGACPHGTFPIPQLRITLTYNVPFGARYAIDTFPDQLRSPLTDHADYIDVMTDEEQAQIVACVNSGRTC